MALNVFSSYFHDFLDLFSHLHYVFLIVRNAFVREENLLWDVWICLLLFVNMSALFIFIFWYIFHFSSCLIVITFCALWLWWANFFTNHDGYSLFLRIKMSFSNPLFWFVETRVSRVHLISSRQILRSDRNTAICYNCKQL